MSELYPTDAELNALSGSTDSEQEVLYIPMGQSPYYTSFYKMLHRLLNVARRSGDLRVYKDGALTFGVRAGRFLNGDTPVNFTGDAGQALTDNAVNYIYLTAAGVLTVNTSGFPAPSATPHLPLATIATGSSSAGGLGGTYAEADITDYRGRAIFQPAGAAATIPEEITSFFAATDITGAEAETLTNNSNADSLHLHNIDNLTDGTSYKKLSASNHGTLTSGGDADSLHSHAAKLNKALASGHIFVGNDSGTAADAAMSGDATISNSGVVTVANGAITNTKIAANAAIARSKMETQQQFPFRIPMTSCRANHFNPLDRYGITTDNTSFIFDNTGWQGETGCGDIRLVSYEADGAGVRTSYCFFEFVIPPEYVTGSTITARLRVGAIGEGEFAATHNIKIQAYKVSDDGAASLPIGNSGAVDLTYNFSNIDVTVNGSTLSPGDRLTGCIRSQLQTTGYPLQVVIGSIVMYCDIRG